MRVDGRARPRDETNVRLLFAFNVPIGIVRFLISTRLLPYTPPSKHRFDLLSAVLSAIAFAFLISGINGIGHGHPALEPST